MIFQSCACTNLNALAHQQETPRIALALDGSCTEARSSISLSWNTVCSDDNEQERAECDPAIELSSSMVMVMESTIPSFDLDFSNKLVLRWVDL